MNPFVEKLKELKYILIIMGVVALGFIISIVLSRLDIVFITLVDFRGLISVGLIFIIFVLGAIAWIALSPTIARPLVMIPFAISIFVAYLFGFAYSPDFGILGMMLIIYSGIFEFRKKKLIFFACFVVYSLFSIIFYRAFALRTILLDLFAFGVAALGLFFSERPFNKIIAGATLAVPTLGFIVLSIFSLGSSSQFGSGYVGDLTAPFEDGLVFRQRNQAVFDDTKYVLEIYRPLNFGYYKQIADYSTYTYFPALSAEDFSWTKIDDDTYRLYFYNFEGSMRFSFLVEI